MRIAGINVGTVTGVSHRARLQGRRPDAQGLPGGGRDDDDLQPGAAAPPGRHVRDPARASSSRATSSSTSIPAARRRRPSANGHTFPISQGTEPVQLDQVLTSLQANTRTNLQLLLKQYGTAVKQAGPSYNASIQYWLPAYEYSAIVAHDALGIQPHDLSNWIDKMGTVAGAIDAHPQNLRA